jgi:hypothetical protein
MDGQNRPNQDNSVEQKHAVTVNNLSQQIRSKTMCNGVGWARMCGDGYRDSPLDVLSTNPSESMGKPPAQYPKQYRRKEKYSG